MKTLEHLIDIFGTPEFGIAEQKGRFVNLHATTKRAQWNKRRNYGH